MSTTIWRTEDVASSNGVHAGSLLHEVTLDSRLDALREVALTLLHEVESLRSLRPPRSSEQPRLPEAVRRFETHLILAALEKTRGLSHSPVPNSCTARRLARAAVSASTTAASESPSRSVSLTRTPGPEMVSGLFLPSV